MTKCPFCGADMYWIAIDNRIYSHQTHGVECHNNKISALKALVREMGEVVAEKAGDYYVSQARGTLGQYACAECHVIKGHTHRDNCSVGLAGEILSRPEFKAIMEETP